MAAYYQIGTQLTFCPKMDCAAFAREEQGIAVLTLDELSNNKEVLGIGDDLLRVIDNIRFCKVEVRKYWICGTFYIPKKHSAGQFKSFAFLMKKGKFIFVDNEQIISPVLERLSARSFFDPAPDYFFYAFLEDLLENDLMYLSQLENYFAKAEEMLLGGSLEFFHHKMMALRKELLAWHTYYAQWVDVGQAFLQNPNGIFHDGTSNLFRLVIDRAIRLQNYTQSLREYSIQLREMFQAQVDIRQNKVMKTLTVVTSIFLPLTLITGWYGMNFSYMPELQWPYSYPILVLICILIVVFSLRYFKKKKYW